MSVFQTAADFYEALAGGVQRMEREGPFLDACYGRAPGNRVLDIACGTGVHAVYFAEKGAEVTAVDASEPMIAQAGRRRPHPKIVYAVQDMRELNGGPWDFAYCLGNSLSLLENPVDLRQTFQAVGAVLAPGGLFAAQILNYASEANQEPRHRIERKQVHGADVVAIKSLAPHRGRTFLTLNFFARQSGGFDRAHDAAILMNWRREDLEDAAAQAGLESEGVYGSLKRDAYIKEKSPDVVGIWRKPKE